MGALENPWAISPRDAESPEWGTVAAKEWEDLRMAVYAAMVDRMDRGIGRVMGALERLGVKDNTLVMFLSDNGGCAELLAEDGICRNYPSELPGGRTMMLGNRPEIKPGPEDTFMSYDLPWANVSNAPFRLYKHWVHEGGISTPLIVSWPNGISERGFCHSPHHVVDIMPTILEVTGTPYPSEFGGGSIQPLDGESLVPIFSDTSKTRQAPIFWEHEGNAAVRMGDWKLVKEFSKDWEVYNILDDRTELNDLSGRVGDRRDEMIGIYENWALGTGVRDWAELRAIAAKRYAGVTK